MDCTQATNLLVSCLECFSTYYTDGAQCYPCTDPYCLNCSATACFECNTTFILSNATCICDKNAGYVINPEATFCVLCDGLVANCQICITSPTVYCQHCSDPFYNST